MRKAFAVLAIVPVLATGCAGIGGAGSDGPVGKAGFSQIELKYNGQPINCIKWADFSGHRGGLSCDYVEWHERFGNAK